MNRRRSTTIYASIIALAAVAAPRAAAATAPTPQQSAPVIIFPANGTVLPYNSTFVFLVQRVPGAHGYLWSFKQHGGVVWQNLDNGGNLSSAMYSVTPRSPAHHTLQPGPMQVRVRALLANSQWTGVSTVDVELGGTASPARKRTGRTKSTRPQSVARKRPTPPVATKRPTPPVGTTKPVPQPAATKDPTPQPTATKRPTPPLVATKGPTPRPAPTKGPTVQPTPASAALYTAPQGFGGWSGAGWSHDQGLLSNDGSGDGTPLVAPYTPPQPRYAVEAEVQLAQDCGAGNTCTWGLTVLQSAAGGAIAGVQHDLSGRSFAYAAEGTDGSFDVPYSAATDKYITADAQWHTYRVEVRGTAVTVAIDGTTVAHLTAGGLTAPGQVGLFDRGYQLKVRSFKVLAL